MLLCASAALNPVLDLLVCDSMTEAGVVSSCVGVDAPISLPDNCLLCCAAGGPGTTGFGPPGAGGGRFQAPGLPLGSGGGPSCGLLKAAILAARPLGFGAAGGGEESFLSGGALEEGDTGDAVLLTELSSVCKEVGEIGFCTTSSFGDAGLAGVGAGSVMPCGG